MAKKQTDSRFVTFENMKWGYRALFVLLRTYILKRNCKTVPQIIRRYAPHTENPTNAYIRTVLEMTGLGSDEVINPKNEEQMKALARAITKVENGEYGKEQDIDGGWLLYWCDIVNS